MGRSAQSQAPQTATFSLKHFRLITFLLHFTEYYVELLSLWHIQLEFINVDTEDLGQIVSIQFQLLKRIVVSRFPGQRRDRDQADGQNPKRKDDRHPFHEELLSDNGPSFDAVAPMVYWLNRDPGSDTANAMQFLTRYNKPLMPIGQAYDGGPEGGRPGVPPPAELNLFMAKAQQYNATSVSFWSWQHANAPAWEAIKNGPSFVKPAQPAAAGG